jgi:hypothetical protein
MTGREEKKRRELMAEIDLSRWKERAREGVREERGSCALDTMKS